MSIDTLSRTWTQYSIIIFLQWLNHLILNRLIIYRNCQVAFSVAERELDIPALLDIGDMETSEKLDKRSILTYLSQFYHKFAKDPAPVPSSRPSLAQSKSVELKSHPTFYSISPRLGDRKGEKLQPGDSTQQPDNNTSLPPTFYPGSCNPAPENKVVAGAAGRNKEDCSNKITRLEIVGLQDKTKSLGQHSTAPVDPNIAAIKHLVFDAKDDSSESTSPAEMTGLTSRESDSGVDQSSDSSSPSSSRLSSVSPSFNKMNRDNEISDKKNDLNSRATRKTGANLIIKPKRSHIITNNRINANQSNKYSQGKRSINKSFQEAIIKFNSLSMQTDEMSSLTPSILTLPPSTPGPGGKQLRSQSCQTEPESLPALPGEQRRLSQQSQTEAPHPSLPPVLAMLPVLTAPGPPKHPRSRSSQPLKRSFHTAPGGQEPGHPGPTGHTGQGAHHNVQRRQERHGLRARPRTSLGLAPSAHSLPPHYPQGHHYPNTQSNYTVLAAPGVYSTLVWPSSQQASQFWQKEWKTIYKIGVTWKHLFLHTIIFLTRSPLWFASNLNKMYPLYLSIEMNILYWVSSLFNFPSNSGPLFLPWFPATLNSLWVEQSSSVGVSKTQVTRW